jgi:hypothetical protein
VIREGKKTEEIILKQTDADEDVSDWCSAPRRT